MAIKVIIAARGPMAAILLLKTAKFFMGSSGIGAPYDDQQSGN